MDSIDRRTMLKLGSAASLAALVPAAPASAAGLASTTTRQFNVLRLPRNLRRPARGGQRPGAAASRPPDAR